MAGGELRDVPNGNRVVTLEYLDELYAKADRQRVLEEVVTCASHAALLALDAVMAEPYDRERAAEAIRLIRTELSA